MKKTAALILMAAMSGSLVFAGCSSGHQHEFPDAWTTVVEATCIQKGKQERTCKYCEETLTREIDYAPHKLNLYSANSENHWRVCSVCKMNLEYAAHNFEGTQCTVCKYDTRGTNTLQYRLGSDGRSYVLTGISGEAPAQVFIPDRYVGLPVTEIAPGAFEAQTALQSITLPSELTTIGSSAFSGCSSLQTLDIPASVVTIGGSAFSGCSSLKSINVAENNRGFSSYGGILYNKSKTICIHVPVAIEGTVSLPETLTEIPSSAFSGRAKFTGIVLHSGLEKIGDMAFYGCSSLTEAVVPASVTSVGRSAFEGCTSLARLVLPFTWQSGLSEPVYDPVRQAWEGDSLVGYIFGAATFYQNGAKIPVSLKTLEFTGGTSLIKYLLNGCKDLEHIVLPDTLTSIEANVFASCTSLQTINIPKDIRNIDPSALSGCVALKSITVSDANIAYADQDGVLYNKNKTQIIIVPAALEGEISIPEGVTGIESAAFRGRKISRVTLAASVQHLAADAFRDCAELRTVVVSDASRLISIGDSAFSGCSALESVTIPASVQTIGMLAFQGCGTLGAAYFKETQGWERAFATDMASSHPVPPGSLADPALAAQELIKGASYYWTRKV